VKGRARTVCRCWVVAIAVLCIFLTGSITQAGDPRGAPPPNLDKDRTLYEVATAHLDTQWLWTIQDTIDYLIPATLHQNFALFDEYPDYVFSFEGAFRYMLAKEYYPQDYARLKRYIAQGRWRVAGSEIDSGDVNVPSPESIIRQILYGNGFFQREFGKTSTDIFLPDCFGFGYALPSAAAHCGLQGFSTQKLGWGSAYGIPFQIGRWVGPDGKSLVSVLDPWSYGSSLTSDQSWDALGIDRTKELGEKYGVHAAYRYFGTGDQGGSPDDNSVAWIEKSIKGGGPVHIRQTASDQLFRDLTPAQKARLPEYRGELLLTTHGTGCYTTHTEMKRWNRKNELLADAAERASVMADWLGGAAYPKAKLREAWIRFLWHQFHDDMTGTSIPRVYAYSQNDEVLSLNQFAETLTNATGAVTRGLNTRGKGQVLVVYNPLAQARQDVVEAQIAFPNGQPQAIRVFGPNGKEVPAQLKAGTGNMATVIFLAQVPSLGYAVYDVRPSPTPSRFATGLQVTKDRLENARYRVRIDANGDIAGFFDKKAHRELLAKPARLELLRETPGPWPAWEISYQTVTGKPYDYIANPVNIQIEENGPARVSLAITRKYHDTEVVQRLRLSAGATQDRLEVLSDINWHTRNTMLKATFPLTVANAKATYDLGLGTIARDNNTERLYEVPAQQWADISAPDGRYGVAILNDCKYGWDKPADNVLRLSLVRNNDSAGSDEHRPSQRLNDLGRHTMQYAIYSHAGSWQKGEVPAQAARLNQPLVAFTAPHHAGRLGKQFAFLKVSSPQVVIRALKKAEDSDAIVVRLQETAGKPVKNVSLRFAAPVQFARELNGAEAPLGPAKIKHGALVVDMNTYQPRTFAITLRPASVTLTRPVSTPVALPFNADVVTSDANYKEGDFDGQGHSYPAELFPGKLRVDDIDFVFGTKADGAKNALRCQGQTINLPKTTGRKLYILAAAHGDTQGTFKFDGKPVHLTVQDFSGFIGQWDNHLRDGEGPVQDAFTQGYLKRQPVAWIGTHRHRTKPQTGNEAYTFCYLFKYSIDLPRGARRIILPQAPGIVIFAMTQADNPNADAQPARMLYDAEGPLAPGVSATQ
jgi:alpha-mannosidase